ncbi:helix-turn-helix transcriptional regulator [Streptomyces sp. NPDC096033]|uniref:helix-turn-helix domain-containing protein n=1 Tax=Streptomyces sp. NPDC096033 TaxID=3366071 RepID=UPI0038155D94
MADLTVTELNVLQGAATGESYAATARRIFITEKSVSNVATRVMRKLGAETMPHAVLLACQAGILDGRPRRHGDHAGYVAHKRRGEDPKDCPFGCQEGELAYKAARWRARRARRSH